MGFSAIVNQWERGWEKDVVLGIEGGGMAVFE